MQNEFERQVRQKMEELQLIPSQPVWEKVEVQIRKKKEKRRFLYFLFLPTLLCGAILYLILISNNRTNNTSEGRMTIGKLKTAKSINHNQQPTESTTRVENRPKPENKSTGGDPVTADKARSVSSKKTNLQFVNAQNIFPNKIIKPRLASKKQRSSGFVVSEEPETLKPSKNESLVVNESPSSGFKINDKQVSKHQPVDRTPGTYADSSGIKTSNTFGANKTSDIFSKKKIQPDSKWHKIASVQVGWSQYKTGLFANAYMGQAYSSGLSSGGSSNYLYYSSPAKKDFSFAISAGLRKDFKSRINLSMSLQFHYYTVGTLVGQLKEHDTIAYYNGASFPISRYYTNSQQNMYIDRVGMIEIPLSLGYQPFKNLPLEFSIGASFGHLIKSNMLTFDYQSNFYYYNKDNNIKNFLGVFSTLQYKVGKKNKKQITAGPIVQFNATEMQHYNLYTMPHLFFWGLKTSLSF